MVFALQGCDVEIMPHYKQAMKALRLGHAPGGWRFSKLLGYDILSRLLVSSPSPWPDIKRAGRTPRERGGLRVLRTLLCWRHSKSRKRSQG